ncbi:MAG: hypothetical protein ABSB78_05565 [Bacteroidota bacterium]
MGDSIHTLISIADTLKVINLTHTPQPIIPLEYLGLLGVILGAIISIFGNLLLSNNNAKVQLKSVLFQRRLDVYTKIVELSWEGYSVVEDIINGKKVNYPRAYSTFNSLHKWLNSMVEVMDKNRFLLDQSTYTNFNHLDWKLLEHVNQLKIIGNEKQRDMEARIIGVNNVGEIQKLTEEFVGAARLYMNRKYNSGFEKVV